MKVSQFVIERSVVKNLDKIAQPNPEFEVLM